MTSFKSTIKIVSLVLVVLFIGGYSLFEARNIISGPKIEISQPINGTTTENPLIDIKGITQNASSISLNDRPITVDKEGAFNEKLLLSPGYNIIKLAVSDRFGRQKVEMLKLILTSNKSLGLIKSQKIN
ncbi:hypothetical protein EXS61_01155 [Candidatus Parcubacteria bacterium]|nr:hypothetical protein [Candidatus Parcubacteria bacterium]